jgi:hypothetical protein
MKLFPKFSFFKAPIMNTQSERLVTISDVYEMLTDQSLFLENTEILTKMTDEKTAKIFKATNFDYVTFSGIFTLRAIEHLVQPSGLIVIDLDNLNDVTKTRDLLKSIDLIETQLLFVSPGGKGLKWVIKTNLANFSHRDYFMGIEGYLFKKYELKIDPSGKDISRACFLCYDPEAFINPKLL